MSVEAVVAADVTERNRKANAVAFGVMVALIAIAPFVAYPFFIMQALCFALFACAFNLLIGYVNLLSLGHAMFLGLASYVCAHAAKVWGLEPVSAIAIGVLAAAALGFVTGALAIRSSGIYFAMITVAFSQMVYFFCVEAPFTHGEDGIQAVPQGRALGLFDLSNPWILYVFVAIVFLFGFLVDPAHRQLAVRRDLEGDPRERAARRLARLPLDAIQARRLHPVGGARRPRRRDQGDRRPERFARPTSPSPCRARSC